MLIKERVIKRFLVIVYAPSSEVQKMANRTSEQQAEVMKPWMPWKEMMSEKLLDFGSPLTNGIRLNSDGSTKRSKKDVRGYSMIQATDMEEAIQLFKQHPHLKWSEDCSLELYKLASM